MMLWWTLAMQARDLENKCHFGGCDKYKTKDREKSWLVVEQKKKHKAHIQKPQFCETELTRRYSAAFYVLFAVVIIIILIFVVVFVVWVSPRSKIVQKTHTIKFTFEVRPMATNLTVIKTEHFIRKLFYWKYPCILESKKRQQTNAHSMSARQLWAVRQTWQRLSEKTALCFYSNSICNLI